MYTGEDLKPILLSLTGIFDGDEPVDELTHAMQCAENAVAAGAGSDLVVAALFHDIARSPLVGAEFPGVAHEKAASMWSRPVFGERVAWLVGAHVEAKLYLLDTDPAYRGLLSSESVRSSLVQRSASDPFPVDHPWWQDALRLRRWDDLAKNPAAAPLDPEKFLQIARPLLAR